MNEELKKFIFTWTGWPALVALFTWLAGSYMTRRGQENAIRELDLKRSESRRKEEQEWRKELRDEVDRKDKELKETEAERDAYKVDNEKLRAANAVLEARVKAFQSAELPQSQNRHRR